MCIKVLAVLVIVSIVETMGQKVDINWDKVVKVSQTVPTLQVVVNPLLERKSQIHDRVFKGLAELNATHVRFVPWLPYPRLAVAELEPPTANSTSWNFTIIDPMVEDFMAAQNGREVIINFSTMPAWLFKTPEKVPYPVDPDQVDWSYTQGTELRDPTLKELGDYYERVVSWYVQGGFVDELGNEHRSGHKFKFDYWEVFNEIESEHNTTPEQYNERYDAVVKAVKKVSPDTKFVGLALQYPGKGVNTFFPHFLNHSNHSPETPLDAVSYHFYALSKPTDDITKMQTEFFDQADNFLKTVLEVEKIRTELSPNTKTMINELGTMHENAASIPDQYWNLSGALFAYVFSKLSYIGIDFAGESQLVGYPTQAPSVSMIDWTTGALNARAVVLKLLIAAFGAGDELVDTRVSDSDLIHGSGIVTKDKRKILLLINKSVKNISVELRDTPKETAYVDVNTGGEIRHRELTSNTIDLAGFAVHVIKF